jgi:hypothetical protein
MNERGERPVDAYKQRRGVVRWATTLGNVFDKNIHTERRQVASR